MQIFKNPKPALAAALAESGPMENGIKKKGDESAKKKKRADRGVSGHMFKVHQQKSNTDSLYRSIWRNWPITCSA